VTYYAQIIWGLFVVHCTCNFNVHDNLRLSATAVIIRALAANYENTVDFYFRQQTILYIKWITENCLVLCLVHFLTSMRQRFFAGLLFQTHPPT